MMKAYCVTAKDVEVVDGHTQDMTSAGLEQRFPEGIVYRWDTVQNSECWRVLQRSTPKDAQGKCYYGQLLPIKDAQLPDVVRLAHMVS